MCVCVCVCVCVRVVCLCVVCLHACGCDDNFMGEPQNNKIYILRKVVHIRNQ